MLYISTKYNSIAVSCHNSNSTELEFTKFLDQHFLIKSSNLEEDKIYIYNILKLGGANVILS